MKNKDLIKTITLLLLMLMVISCSRKKSEGRFEPLDALVPTNQTQQQERQRRQHQEQEQQRRRRRQQQKLTQLPSRTTLSLIPPTDNVDLDLKLLLTDYFRPSQGQESGYGYYVYLAFLDDSSATRAKRLKTSEAFVCSFASTTEEDVR